MPFADWGKIANPNFDQQRVKGVYFFAGDWRSSYNPVVFYGPPVPGPNDGVYTVHPADGRHLGWSIVPENRSFAVSEMARAGLNTVVMSYWGEPDTDRWRAWAPMQTSTEAHDQLFTEAVVRNLLIMPAIEGGAATANSPAFIFADEFPPADPATCSLTHQITDLVQRYLKTPQNNSWSDRWLTLYDQTGVPRRAIYIIQVLVLRRIASVGWQRRVLSRTARRIRSRFRRGGRSGFRSDAGAGWLSLSTPYASRFPPLAKRFRTILLVRILPAFRTQPPLFRASNHCWQLERSFRKTRFLRVNLNQSAWI
jgi:hypothetical protein